MNRLPAALAFLLLTVPPLAAETVEDLAKQYVEQPQVQQMMTDMFAPANMAAQVRANLPPNIAMSEDQAERIGTLLSGEMNALRPRLQALMISASAATFSPPEMAALLEFYGSEHGAAVMTKMGPFMQTVMQQLAPEIQAVQQRVAPQVVQILQEQK